jgi:DNA-binding NarL/FixJ family response regulator
MTTIVLADDHHIVRQGLRALLETEPDFAIVGESGDGLETVQLAGRLQPHVLIVDLMMPGLNGLEVTRQVRQRSPQTQIIILSMHSNEAYVLEALRNGAAGYVLKDARADELIQAVRKVMAGQYYLSSPLSERAIEAYAEKARGNTPDLYETLTTREREVLHLAAEGKTNAEIAARLFISPRTVEVHRANLMRKLDLHSPAALIHYAIQRGLVARNE